MSLEDAGTQLPQTAGARPRAAVKTMPEPRHEQTSTARCEPTSPGAGDLLGQALARQNMAAAWKRVKANKGSAGVDGRTVQDAGEHLKTAWPEIRGKLLDGTYRPAPVRRVGIPKPGGGTRELGIPTVVDRLIQQALLQVLQPLIDPTFSEHSYGFRPGRSAQQAVVKAQQYVRKGREVVWMWTWRNSSIASITTSSWTGWPSGLPTSGCWGLLANVLLDEVDRELQRRGHSFVRYADDCNVYVRSFKAGQRVLQALRQAYARLKLRVNEAKTAVAPVWERKFLGYCMRRGAHGQVTLAIAEQAVQKARERVRQITQRHRGCSMGKVVQDLQSCVPGWKAYFGLTESRTVLRELDQWLRRRLRAVQLNQWKTGPTVYRALRRLGAPGPVATYVARHTRRWWHCSLRLSRVLDIAYFDRLGVPHFC